MQTQLNTLRSKIREMASDPKFIHHKWFVKWHLEIVERISLELCDKYEQADKDIVVALVWIHDYAKILDFENQHAQQNLIKSKVLLQKLGFDNKFIDKLMAYLFIFEDKMNTDISKAPIEVQIVSSADAASHMVGPFYALYWYENPDKPIEKLLEANMKKLHKDWERKITLPEVKRSFKTHYDFIKLMSGVLPDKLL